MAYFTGGRKCIGGCGRRQGTTPSGFYSGGFDARGKCPKCVKVGNPDDASIVAMYAAQAAWDAAEAAKAKG